MNIYFFSSSKLNPKGVTSPRNRTTSHEQTPPVPPVSVYAPPRGASPSPTASSSSSSSGTSLSGVVQGTSTGGGGDVSTAVASSSAPPPPLTSSSSASRITQHGVSPSASTEESIQKEKSAEKSTTAPAGYTPPLPRKNSNTSLPRKPE